MAIAVTGIAALGLFPFVTASFGHFRGHSPEESNLYMLAQWIYRLYSHPVLSLSRLEVVSATLGFALAVGVVVYSLIRHPFAVETASAGLMIALSSGAVVTLIASFLFKSFNATNVTYSIWMMPGLTMLLSSGLAAKSGWARRRRC